MFYLIGDQRILWESGLLKKGETKEINVDLRSIDLLAIYISDAGDGHNRDYVNLAQARFITRGPVNVYEPEQNQCEIWPSEAPNIPSINGPSVIGARPGSPILHRLPVSGKAPFKIRLGPLPKGLKFNSTTRVFTGSIKKQGNYRIRVRAKNEFGIDEEIIEFKIGKEIALTPPMGWNSWNVWGDNIDQDKIRDAGRTLKSSRLADYGWSYIVIDDGWQGNRDNVKNSLQPNKKFRQINTLIEEVS